jgi:PAS domain-containing protein
VSSVWTLALLLVAAILSLLPMSLRRLRLGCALTCLLVVMTVASGLALMMRGWLALPVVQMATVEVLVLGVVVWRRTARADAALVSLLEDANESLSELGGPASFAASSEHWNLVASALDQTLTLDRVIILEAVPGQHKVRELAALRCTIDDVVERRRDIRRPPYSTALSLRAPLRVDRGQWSFLEQCAEGEQQYLVPLVFGREVFGFLAVGIGSDEDREDERFISHLRSFAAQIEELLYIRHHRRSSGTEAGPLIARLAFHQESEVERAVLSTVQLMAARADRLRRLLARLSNPTIVYDLFGRVLEANPAMLERFAGEELDVSETTALDMLAALTRRDREYLRELLRHVLLEGGETSLRARLRSQRDRSFVLRLTSLPPAVGSGEEEANRRPLGVVGLVCELVDVTSARRLGEIERVAASNLDGIHKRLSSVEHSAAALLETDEVTAEQQDLVGRIREAAATALRHVEESRPSLDAVAALDPVECYPVNPWKALEKAVERVGEALDDEGFHVDLPQAGLPSLAFASARELPDVFSWVLAFLATGPWSPTPITVAREESADELRYRFQVAAPGSHVDELGTVLEGKPAAGLQRSHAELRRGRRWLRTWGGELDLAGEDGRGVTVTVRLRAFA